MALKFPLSLHVRLGLLSIAMVIVLFVVNTRAMIPVAEGMVVDNIDLQLDSHVRLLVRAIDRDGRLDMAALSSLPELVTPWSGWGWEVRTPAGHWHKGPLPGQIDYPWPRINVDSGIYSGKGDTMSGQAVHVRRLDPGRGVTIIVMSPRRDIERELDRLRQEFYKVAAEIVLVLVVATILQITVGLYPLRKLVKDVTRVRSGESPSVPERQPSDLHLLASEINALIARNNAGLETARIHAANLAHAVKTPLATLMLQLEYERASPEAQALVAHVSERVAHHLHRARSATAGAGAHVRADLQTVMADVKNTLSLAHRGGSARIVVAMGAPCHAAVDPEDLGEMVGNLVDNACRYAGSRVEMSAQDVGARVIVRVEDDGAGIPGDQLLAVLQPGVRLDEVSTGYGLGLAIVRELAELYEGTLTLTASPRLGGLCATLDLPQ